MAINVFDPQLVIERLRDQVAALKTVGEAPDYATAMEDVKGKRIPAAYVLDLATKPAANETGTVRVSQRCGITFAVVLAVQNLRDPRGEKAKGALRAVRIPVITALLGWKPSDDPQYDICTLGPGRVLGFDDQVLFWQDDFYTALYLRT